MKIINKIMAGLLVSVSCLTNAIVSELQPVAPDEKNEPASYEDQNLSVGFSSNGRYIVSVEKVSVPDAYNVRFHRYDTVSKINQSSRFIESSTDYKSAYPIVASNDANIVNFTYSGNDAELDSNKLYEYDFDKNKFSELLYSNSIIDISENGRYQLGDMRSESNGNVENYWILDRETGIKKIIPSYDSAGDGSNIANVAEVGKRISSSGDVLVRLSNSVTYKYNTNTEGWYSLSNKFLLHQDVAVVNQLNLLSQISENGRYAAFVASNDNRDTHSVILMVDTVENKVFRYDSPDAPAYTIIFPNVISDDGKLVIAIPVTKVGGVHSTAGVVIIYDFILGEEIVKIKGDGTDADVLVYNYINISSSGESVAAVKTTTIGGKNYKQFKWLTLSTSSVSNEISVSPIDLIIDPYTTPSSQFAIDVSGADIYGLDVSCNLSSASLSVTQASYSTLFGSQNSMTLPLIYDTNSVTGTETLVAPELPFSGTGSFVLADVIAEFTTEDIQITCAAEVSDERGQLLQVTLTPATIRIDDGVHGGTGSVSGVIEIPGVTDLSGVEVVLTIDGRQVAVITDETGRFEFDGLRDGEFTISLASDNYVQSCQAANVADGGAVDLGSIELLAGDINADGSIDIADFTFMAARYRSNQGDADYDAKADLNKDGTINIQDLAILGSHFGSTQCNL
jgi:hypothetical protein